MLILKSKKGEKGNITIVAKSKGLKEENVVVKSLLN